MRPTVSNFCTFVGLPVLVGLVIMEASADNEIGAIAPVALGLLGLVLWLILLLFGDIAILIVRRLPGKRSR